MWIVEAENIGNRNPRFANTRERAWERERVKNQEAGKGDDSSEAGVGDDVGGINSGSDTELPDGSAMVHNGAKDVRDVVTPLWRVSYDEQIRTKEASVVDALKKIVRKSRKCCQRGQLLPDWIYSSRDRGGLPCDFLGVARSPVVDGYRNKCEFAIGYSADNKPTERRGRQGAATSRGRYIDGAARSDEIEDRGHDLLDPGGGAMTGGAGSSGAGGSGGAQFNPLSEKEMAKLRRGNIVWKYVTAGQYVGDQPKMHGDRKLRCNLCGQLCQGGSLKAASHFTQSKFCKAGGMRVLAELWNGTDYTFVPSTAQRLQRWMADEGIRDTRAPAGGQRQRMADRMDDAERDGILDALDEEGREGGAREGAVADELDEAVGQPNLPGEEVVMTSRGVGGAGPATRAPRVEVERARKEKRTVGQAGVEVPDTGREKRVWQTTIEEMYAREKLAEFTDAWLQWIYVKKLPFNAFRGPEFQRVRVTAGAGIPSQRAKVATMVSEVRATFRHSGATILSDGRKSRSGKPLVNFLAGGANGALLYATLARDGSVRDTADVVYRRWRAIILSFPAKDVIGFCTDSASNYTAAARRFATDPEPEIRRITWLPCSTHVCNLMLSDIGTRVVWVKETIIRARALVRFIKSHGAAHTLFRKVSPRVQLVEPVEIRFASVFLMLTCLKGRRDALESMLHGDAWARISWDRAHVSQAQWVQQQIRDGEFWQRVHYAILVMSPVHQLLRRMDRGGMMMSVVYEWSQHLLQLMRRVDVPEDMIEPCVREVAIRNLHMLDPAHAAAHLLNPRRRSLTYYHSLETTADDRRVVEECDRSLLAQTGGDLVGLLYRTVRDQMRAFHSRRGDWGDRDLSDVEAADCRGDSETERCAAWWFEHGRAHPELRTITIRVMHLWTSASPAERNWAEHERVSTARRCKLGFAKLAQLVEIVTNLKLASCARQGGGYVLPWVMGTGRGGTAAEEEDEEGDVEPERQIVAFRDSRPSRARSVRDVFGSRATELRPWPEGGDDVDAAEADDDIYDDWTDDDDTPLSRNPTAERLAAADPAVVVQDVHMRRFAWTTRGSSSHGEVFGTQADVGRLGATARPRGRPRMRRCPFAIVASLPPIIQSLHSPRGSHLGVRRGWRRQQAETGHMTARIVGGERTPSDASIRPRSPSVLRTQDFEDIGLGGILGDLSVEGRRRASPQDVRTDADVERGPVETEEERDARLDREEEERLRSLPQWEGRFTGSLSMRGRMPARVVGQMVDDATTRRPRVDLRGTMLSWAAGPVVGAVATARPRVMRDRVPQCAAEERVDTVEMGTPRVSVETMDRTATMTTTTGVRGRESGAGEVGSGRRSDDGRDSAGSMPPPPARTPEARVDTANRTVAPGVAHSGGSPPLVRGGVGGGWSAVRRVGDGLRADYDAGRGVFTGRTPVQTQAAEGGSGRPSLQMAGRMLGLSRAETRRTLVLEAAGTSTDRLRGEQFTSGEEGLSMLKHKKGCYNRVVDALLRHPEFLTCLVSLYGLQRKLKEDLVEHTAKDPDLSPILEQLKADPSSQPDFHECDGLVFLRYGKFDRLCVPNHAPLRTQFLDLAHGRSGHFDFEKTYGSLLQQFDWPGMKGSAKKFIVECQVCQRTKVHRHKPYGLFKPLPIPDGPGESISIDFTDMGKVSEAANSQVMVIVERFSKFLNLIPFPPHAPTELVIEEFHQQYILQFGQLKTIVSDRDTRFISKDWKDFTSQIYDIKLNKTSGRHPEANGLAEEINQIVIQLLRTLIFPDQNTWDKELHKVKGLYNNSIHSATGVTPNQLQYGWQMRNPLSYLFPERSPGLTPGMPGYNAKYARLLKAAIAAMNKRQHAMIKHANKSRKEANFKVGDYVWVKMSEFSDEEGVSRKLLPLYYGPWQALKVIGDEFGPSYVIDVPPHLRTYPVFHASKLFPHIDDETFPFRDPMIPRPINGGHEIDRIVSHQGRGRNRQYKVHLLYHPLNEFCWIDRKELLKNAPRVVNAYERQIADGQIAKFSAKLTPYGLTKSLFLIYAYDAFCADSE
ncbi:hypothetical protein CBR_g8738 [Chara braunii]|uniref:Integrase catalytic domain-containing protein n=1 Tax=Chara braunii TaxID=69332 RepID=A0A388KMM6_CHABU|nr:hypothetical protein CBR_g8738 [Chara braunii]|eukprot:GBG71316.1 hypothetical protein CBR_g8738 [Chara braunii]